VTQPERDPRVYFAAERTLLAWIRTGLALMGFGFVVARFGWFLREIGSTGAPLQSSGYSVWTGTLLVIAGVVINLVSTLQHVRLIRHLKEGRDVTGKVSATGVALGVLLAVIGIAMAVYLVTVR
jgi:putative membrane protein